MMNDLYTATSLYVDYVNGDDKKSGLSPKSKNDFQGPVKTIGRALEIITEIRKNGIENPITVKVMSALNYLSKLITVDGTMKGVTVEPYGENDMCSVIGGITLDGIHEAEFNGVRCLAAPVPEGLEFTDFFVNYRRAKYTRYPDEGYLYPESVEVESTKQYDGSSWFIAEEGDLDCFDSFDGAFVSYNHWWCDEHSPIAEYDRKSRRVTMKYRSRFAIGGERGSHTALEYCIENCAIGFKNPGEWYCDRATHTVYYIPRKDDDINTLTFSVPTLPKLIHFAGAEDVIIRGIDFSLTTGDYASGGMYASDVQSVCSADGAITFENSADITLEDCTLSGFGLHGFMIGCGCHDIRIVGCDITDGGAGGIRISGGSASMAEETRTHHITVSNNIISSLGRRYLCGCGILLQHADHCELSHNEISDLYYTGISVGWVWGYDPSATHHIKVTKNHIYNIGQGMLSDMGGIYLLGTQKGTVVSGNLIHDIKSKHYGGWALYTDEGSSYITLENNVCYNASSNCFHQHYGSHNLVRNNIFAFAGVQTVRVNRDELHTCTLFDTNIFYSKGTPIYSVRRNHISYRSVASSSNLIFDTENEEPTVFVVEDGKYSFGEAREMGFEQLSVVADPKFTDPDNYCFTLAPDSPAYAIGFRDIDLSDVGVKNADI